MNSTCGETVSESPLPSQYVENNGCTRIDDGSDHCGEDASAVEVAEFLLEQKLYLTALEYYFEQLERGKRISVLGTFFSNASFFEQINPVKDDGLFGIVHYQSISTLDSIDIGRISDDGNNLEEKLKVLEYELRKKSEEIQSLRTELTQLTVGNIANGSIPTMQATADRRRGFTERPILHSHRIRLHEIRALGVLINDYLLQNNYRFTAVQFSEESESTGLPSVESWEQVGVNLPKPPSLVNLLRSYWSIDDELSETGAYVPRVTEVGTASESANPFDEDLVNGNQLNSAELQARLDELALLKAQVIQLETKNAQLMTQAQHWRNQLICLEREHAEIVQKPFSPSQQPLGAQAASCDSVTGSHIPNNDGLVSVSLSTSEAFNVCTRSISNEFRQHMTNLLPRQMEIQRDASECPMSFQLVTSLDEFIQLVADRLQSILLLMTDECKILCLPLLTQAICLHHDSQVRDSLLRLLFNLFSTQPPPSNTIVHNSAHLSTVAENYVSSIEHSIGRDRYRLLILNECRRLASYMGPTRLESELIPQLWSQLNERPPPPVSQRLLIVSACGVISPSIPAHLQSSLMLSILESNLNEERDELVRAASIRSLACLTCLISDWDKLPHLVQRLNRLLLLAPSNSTQRFQVCLTEVDHNSLDQQTTITSKRASAKPTFITAVDWLLPAVAQWCLELDSLHTTLIDPWLDHLDTYILASQSLCNSSVSHEMVIHTLSMLGYLVPFLHAWSLITLIRPQQPEQTYWSAALIWASTTERARESPASENGRVTSTVCLGTGSQSSSDSVVNVCLILGSAAFRVLQENFEVILDQPREPANSSTTSVPEMQSPLSPTCCTKDHLVQKWAAKMWLQTILLPKLNELLIHVSANTSKRSMTDSPVSLYDHKGLLEAFVLHQYDAHFACPWHISPQSDPSVSVCLAVCQFLTTFGVSLGSVGVQKYLAVPLQAALMHQTEFGNFEFDHHAVQTGLLAGYCCLMASVKVKSLTNKVRMLLTNAIFLHIRECYPLDSIRLTFWCLCFTGDLDYVLLELIIPSLRPCVGCADSIVRRASASLLHSVIEAVRCAQISSTVNCTDTPTSGPQPNGFDSLFQLISQVARDDLTGQRKLINSDEADWSVLALATGPLYSFLTFCRKGLSSCSASNGTASVDAPSPAIRFPVSDGLTSTERVSVDFEEQLYELIRLQFNLVIGVSDSSSLTEPDTSGTTVGILATQQRFWPVLTLALLSLTDHLLPSCPNSFRDEVVLPWLYKLTEMSNSLSNVEQRAQLADRLFAVLSTAAYSVQLEESLFLWLVPGLDRVRLDLIEAGDTMRTHEVELFLNDLYSRIRADESGIISDKPKESGGLRNAVSNQLARLKSRSLNPSGHMHRHGASRHSDLGQVKVGSSRLGLRKR